MLYANLDAITKGLLLKMGKSIHYYYEFLKHATDGLRFLTITTLRNVHYEKVLLTDYKAAPIPCNYVDWVVVGFEAGERIRPLIEDNSLNSLKHYDGNVATPYTEPNEARFLSARFYDRNPDFGVRTDRGDYRFKVIPERNEIQLSAHYPFDYVIIGFISDGLRGNAATEVNTLAQQCLEQWMRWRYEDSKRNNSAVAAEHERKFEKEFRILRASTNNLTPAQVVQAVRSGYGPLPKT